MIRPETDDLIAFLNSLVAIDPNAMDALLRARVTCNEDLAKHPTVQVGHTEEVPGKPRVGILGILNGWCGTIDDPGPAHGYGPIAAVFEGGWLVRFDRIERHVLTAPGEGEKVSP